MAFVLPLLLDFEKRVCPRENRIRNVRAWSRAMYEREDVAKTARARDYPTKSSQNPQDFGMHAA